MSALPNLTGTPGIATRGDADKREIFTAPEGSLLLTGGRTIDGSQTRDPLNTGNLSTIRAGTLMGQITSGKKWAPTILATIINAEIATATEIEVTAAQAAELVRRIGATGTFGLVGPPTVAGTVISEQVTYTAVDTATGIITVDATTAAFIAGSWIVAEDGSETIRGVLHNVFGVRVTDADGVNIDHSFNLGVAGQINTSNVLLYPTDASLIARVKTELRAVGGGYVFDDDFE